MSTRCFAASGRWACGLNGTRRARSRSHAGWNSRTALRKSSIPGSKAIRTTRSGSVIFQVPAGCFRWFWQAADRRPRTPSSTRSASSGSATPGEASKAWRHWSRCATARLPRAPMKGRLSACRSDWRTSKTSRAIFRKAWRLRGQARLTASAQRPSSGGRAGIALLGLDGVLEFRRDQFFEIADLFLDILERARRRWPPAWRIPWRAPRLPGPALTGVSGAWTFSLIHS